MNTSQRLLQSQRIIEKKKVQSQWLKGLNQKEYEEFICNAFYLEKRLSIVAQLKETSAQMQQLETEIINLQKVKYTKEYMKNANILSPSHELDSLLDPNKYYDMEKIGKKGGSVVKRSVFFQGENLCQAKNINSKNLSVRILDFPISYNLETFDEFMNLSNQSKIKEMAWSKTSSQKGARLILMQAKRSKGMAVYFDTIEQATLIRDYIVCIKTLKNSPNIKNVFKIIAKSFQNKVSTGFKEVLRENHEYNLKKRVDSVKNNSFLQQLDGIVMKCFLNTTNMASQFKRAQYLYQEEIEILRLKGQQEQGQLIVEQQQQQQKQQTILTIEEMGSRQFQAAPSSQSEIYNNSNNNSNNVSAYQTQNEINQGRKQLWLINQNEFLQQFDREVFKSFAYSWRKAALKRKKDIESQKKNLILTFQEIELESKIDLIKPILSITLVKESEGGDVRIVNEQQVATNSEGEYYTAELQCRVKSKMNASTITWYLFCQDNPVNQSSQPHYMGPSENLIPFQSQNQPRENLSNYQMNISQYDMNDALIIELRDSGSSDKQQKAKGKFYLSELCCDSSTGKRNWINLDFRNFLFSQDTSLPIIKLDSFISPSLIPNARNFEDIIQYYVDYNLPFVDPIYGEYIQFPNLTKKQIKIVQKTLEKKEIINDELKFLRLTEYQEIFTLKKLKKNAILKFNKQISIENAKLKKNIDLIVQLQELLLKVREANTPTNNNLIHPPNSPSRNLFKDDERDDLGSVTLSKLLSERKTWRQKCPQAYTLLEDICREGIPNYLRMQIWKSLGRVQELKMISERSWSQFTSIKNYYSHNQVDLKGGDDESHLTLYEHFLRGSIETYLVLQQQIRDDIKQYLKGQKERSIHALNMNQIENIMNAFVFWSIMIGTDSNSSHFAYINYSPELITICDKIGLYYSSQSLPYDDIDLMNEQVEFKKEEEVFWLLVSLVYFILKSHYRFNPNIQHEGMRGSLKIKEYMPNMFPPLQTNKLVGLKAELLLLKILIKENIPDLATKLNEIGLPTEHYFSTHLITMFSNMVNTDTVFRIWDIILFESALEHEGHTNMLMLSVIITLLQQAKEDILKCKRVSEVEIILKIHGFFIISSSEFIKQVLENKKKFTEKLAFYLNILLNLEDELKIHYNQRVILNQKINHYVNGKSDFDKCDAIQISEVSKIVEKLKERDNKRKYAMDQRAGEDQDDSLEIPDQFEDENEKEMYQLNENKFLSHMMNKQAVQQQQQQTVNSGIGGDQYFNQNYITNTINLTSNINQTIMNNNNNNNNNFNIDLFNQYQDGDYQAHQQQAQQMTIFRRPQLRRVFLYLHKLKLFWAENTEIVMEVLYEQQSRQDIKIIVDTCIFLNHFEEFQYMEGYDKLIIRLYEDPKTLSTDYQGEKRLIKEGVINLNFYNPDYLIKTTLVLEDSCKKQQGIHNYTTSEIDVSIILLSERYAQYIQSPFPNNALSLSALKNQASVALQNHPTKLVNYLFKIDDKTKTTDYSALRQFFKNDIQNIPIFNSISHYSFEPSQKINWRLNSETTFENMRMFLKIALNDGSISGLSNVNFLKNVYDYHINNSQNKVFYFMDFIIAIVLFATSTFKQKLSLCFDLLQVFDSSRDDEQLVHMNSVLEFVKYLYDYFMIYIPDNQIYDMVEYAILGSVNTIVKAELTVKDNNNIVIDVTKEIINMQNQNNLQAKCKDIFLGNSTNLGILKNVLDEKIKNQIEGLNNSLYMLNIKYRVEGLLTKFTCLIDKDWKVTKRIILDKRPDLPYKKPDDSQPIQQVMHNNENLISLSNQNLKLTKKQFIEVMERLPMLRYLVNFQNIITQVANVSSTLNQDQFTLPNRKILMSSIQVTFTVMVNNRTFIVLTANDDRQKRIINFRLNTRQQNPLLQENNSDSVIGGTPSLSKKQHSSNMNDQNNIQQPSYQTLQLINQNLLLELKQKRQNISYNVNRQENKQFNYNNEYNSVLNQKISFSFFTGLEEVLLMIENLILQETINQLDIGQTSLLALDFQKLYLELYLQNQKLIEFNEKSIYDFAHLHSNQALNFKMVYTYNTPSKMILDEKETKSHEIFQMDKQFNQLGKFMYSEFLSEWMPCCIEQKYTSSKKMKSPNDVSYFFVRFKHLPKNLFLKKQNEVLIITQIDINELEERDLDDYNQNNQYNTQM